VGNLRPEADYGIGRKERCGRDIRAPGGDLFYQADRDVRAPRAGKDAGGPRGEGDFIRTSKVNPFTE
jgi:hypothetical protein